MPSTLGGLFSAPEGTPGQIIDVTPDEFLGLRGPLSSTILNALRSGPAFQIGGNSTQNRPANIAEEFRVPIGEQEQRFINHINEFAFKPQPLTEDSIQLLRNTISGDFLSSGENPFLFPFNSDLPVNPVFEQFVNGTNPQLDPVRLTGLT